MSADPSEACGEMCVGCKTAMCPSLIEAGTCIFCIQKDTARQRDDNGKLRESRAIGQDADFVSTIEKFWLDDKMREHDDERRRLRNDKNRGGRRGWKMDMRFLGSVFQFREDSEP